MIWDEFRAAAPELAALGEERLRGKELCLVGTLRKNGWPRISPVEPDFVDGELMLGMMPRSPKALDLLRDPRLVVHSVVSNRVVTFEKPAHGLAWGPTGGLRRWTIDG